MRDLISGQQVLAILPNPPFDVIRQFRVLFQSRQDVWLFENRVLTMNQDFLQLWRQARRQVDQYTARYVGAAQNRLDDLLVAAMSA